MAEIVAGFTMPHVPLIASAPSAPSLAQRQACMAAYERIVQRLREFEIDTVIVVGDDHYTIHSPACIPQALIGIGDVEGPWEKWLGIEKKKIPNNEPLAHHIMRYGFANGLDWAVAKALTMDHSATIPIHFAVRPAGDLRVIPVYLNSGVEPVISSSRAYRIGQVIGDAVSSWEGSERVAIFGTGGLSHWPGMAEMGRTNADWDRSIIASFEKGDVTALMTLTDEDIMNSAGNGGLEIKNWLCAVGALGRASGQLIAYEAVTEWVCGCAFMELIKITETA